MNGQQVGSVVQRSRPAFPGAMRHEAKVLPVQGIGAGALGALALGALAVGALAIGALAIGRLAIGRSRIRQLEIDALVVRRLHVIDALETPRGDRLAR